MKITSRIQNRFINLVGLLLVFSAMNLCANTVVIPIVGNIEPSVYKFLKRSLKDATNNQNQAERIIIKINTFGGELNTTFQIVDLISSVDLPVTTIVEEKAVSAGTLIAMAAREIYMISNSIMGDVAPVTMGAEGPTMLGEKFQSPLRAKFRALAQKNGYPVKLSEAFVSTEKEIIEITYRNGKKVIIDGVEFKDLSIREKNKIINRKTIVAKGELLTMSAGEAVKLGFSKKTVGSIKDVVDIIKNTTSHKTTLANKSTDKVIFIEKTIWEDAFRIFLSYSWLLILIGLGGVYLEVQNPGFGFYGIIAISSFMVFFIGQYLVELATYIEFIALLIGLIFLAIEIFVLSGFGIFGLAGIILLFCSLVLMKQNFVIPQDVFEWDLFTQNAQSVLLVFTASLIVLIVSFIFAPRYMKRSPLVFTQKLFESEEGQTGLLKISNNHESKGHSSLKIGDEGKSITALSPSGRVLINSMRLDAIVKNDYVEIDKKVRIIGFDGFSVVVEKKKS